MLSKEFLIEHLKELIAITEQSEGTQVALQNIRKSTFIYPFWNEDLEIRFHRLEKKIDYLLDKPSTTCRMDCEDGQILMDYMTGAGKVGRVEAINFLRNECSGAKQLVICDPYFLLSNSKFSKADYLAGIDEAIPKSVTSIELFVMPYKRDSEVATGFTKLCKNRSIKLTCRKTKELHDRVWIVDHTRAFVVGTSFNGLGNKCAFILKLPELDMRSFTKELDLLRERTTKSRSA